MTHPAERLQDTLALAWPPVAIAFRLRAPARVPRIDTAAASGCTYWKLAAQGHVFYTEAADHHNCPIGAHTHGIDLPLERQAELEDLITTMVDLQYLREEEIEAIPRRTTAFGVAIYAAWAVAPCDPDVILVRGNAKQLMVLSEAAHAAGIGDLREIMGRPTCAMIPATMQHQRLTVSLGCIGNRVYNDLENDELYAAIPAERIDAVLEQLTTIAAANLKLEAFHRERMASLSH